MVIAFLLILSPCLAGSVYAANPTVVRVGDSENLVTYGLKTYTGNTGQAIYNADNKTLTLKNDFRTDKCYGFADYQKAGIYCEGDLNIILEKTNAYGDYNYISSSASGYGFIYGIYATGNITIKGDGKLTLSHSTNQVTGYIGIGTKSGSGGSIYIGDDNDKPTVEISDASSYVSNKEYNYGIQTDGLAMVHNGTINATACKGIKCSNLTVLGGEVNATGSSSYNDSVGIDNGASVKGGKLTAKGKGKAINGSVAAPIIIGGTSYDGTGKALEDSYNAAWKYAELDATRFIIQNFTGKTYDGSQYAATTANIRNFDKYKYGPSNVTFEYYDEDESSLGTEVPINAGNYKVTAKTSDMKNPEYFPFTISPRSIDGATVTLGAALTYSGSSKTKDISSVEFTSPSLTLTNGTDYTVTGNKQTNAGTYTMTLTGKGNYTGTKSQEWRIDKKNPEASDFNVSATTDMTYDGNPKSVAAPTLISPKSGCGTITMYYVGNSYPRSNIPPTNTGTYTVTFDVAEGSNFNSATGLSYGTLKINKAANPAAVLTGAVVKTGGNTIELSEYVQKNKATGDVTYSISGEALGCTIDGTTGVLTSGDQTGSVTVEVNVAEDSNYEASGTLNMTVKITDKDIQTLRFENSHVDKVYGDPAFTNPLSGAYTNVTYSVSGGDDVVSVDPQTGEVTILKTGEAEVKASAEESIAYEAAEKTYSITVSSKPDTAAEDKKMPIDKVPVTGSNKYASSNDNLAPVADSGKINQLKLDFSNVSKSDVKPTDLKMTVIKGSKFTTEQKIQDASGASGSGGIKVKVNKKTLIPTISCKSDGSATLTMDDGVAYTVAFTVQKPKADKSMKKMPVASEGSAPVIRSIRELFTTDIDSGDLKVTKGSHATVSENVLVIDPTAKDSMKVEYQYLNKKFKTSIKIK